MKKNISVKPSLLQLCSRCTNEEINSWMFEKQAEFPGDTMRQMRQELKSIKLKQGRCIVCNHEAVSDMCFENILRIMEENEVSDQIKNEFKKLFGFECCI